MFFESVYAGSLSFFNPFDISQESNNINVNTQVLLANDAYSLKGLFNDLDSDLYNNNDYFAIGDIRYDMGTNIKDVGYIGYTYRQEAIIKASSDAILLIHQAHHDLNLTRGKDYNLNLDIEGFETHGITFSTTLPTYRKNDFEISLAIAGELLHGTNTQHGNINGTGEILNERDYDVTLQSKYFYTENYLYDLNVNPVSAYGYSTHIALLAKYRNTSFSLVINDLYGKLYWKNLPFSDVLLASGNKTYNDEGYVEYAPVVSGLEETTDFTQILMPKWRMEGSHRFFEKNLVKLGTEHIYGIYLPYINYTYFNEKLITSINYENYFGMLGIDMNYEGYSLGIHSNGIEEPSAVRINFGLNYIF